MVSYKRIHIKLNISLFVFFSFINILKKIEIENLQGTMNHHIHHIPDEGIHHLEENIVYLPLNLHDLTGSIGFLVM